MPIKVAGIEKRIISKIIEEQSLKDIHKLGISPEHFSGKTERDIFKSILAYEKKYGDVPTDKIMYLDFPDYELIRVKESWPVLLDKLLGEYKKKTIDEILADIVEAWDDDDQRTFLQEYAKVGSVIALKSFIDTQSKTEQEGDFDRVWDDLEYERSREEQRIPSGIDVLEEAVGGLRQTDTVVISGLPGDGKSALLMHIADAAHLGGKRVLFFTFEMSVKEVRNRWVARRANVPVKVLEPKVKDSRGNYRTLRQVDTEGIKGVVEDLFGDDSGLSIVELDFEDATFSGMKSHIVRFNPDVVFIDGAYMINDESKKETQTLQIAQLLKDLRRYTIGNLVPVVMTTQALRGKVGADGIGPSSIGYSSSWEQYATIYFGIHREEEQPSQQQLRIWKLRNGFVDAENIPIISWDFANFTSKNPEN